MTSFKPVIGETIKNNTCGSDVSATFDKTTIHSLFYNKKSQGNPQPDPPHLISVSSKIYG